MVSEDCAERGVAVPRIVSHCVGAEMVFGMSLVHQVSLLMLGLVVSRLLHLHGRVM
jgi:hypothetical protein